MDEIGSLKNTIPVFGLRYNDNYEYTFRNSSGEIIVQFRRGHIFCCMDHSRFFVDCKECQMSEAMKIITKPLRDEIDFDIFRSILKGK